MKKILLGLALAVSSAAHAFTWSEGGFKVTFVEPTYAPQIVTFKTTPMPSACSSILVWVPRGVDANAQTDNAKAVFASLLTAMSGGNNVTLYGTGCSIEFVHLNPS